MTDAVLPYQIADGPGWSGTWRWPLAFLVVLLLHAAVVVGILSWPRPSELAAEPPTAVMIDLAPLPAAPSADEILSDLPLPEPAPVELPDPVTELAIDLAEPAPVELPEPVTELAIELPEPPPIDLPPAISELAIDLSPPAEPDRPEPPVVEPPSAKPVPPPTRRPPRLAKPAEQATETTDPPRSAAPQPAEAAMAAAPPSTVADEQAVQPLSDASPSWRSLVNARLKRAVRYPRMAARRGKEGIATIQFRINRQGEVLGVTLLGGSGIEEMDEEALAVLLRVSPLPAPPPEMMSSNERNFTAPIVFNLP